MIAKPVNNQYINNSPDLFSEISKSFSVFSGEVAIIHGTEHTRYLELEQLVNHYESVLINNRITSNCRIALCMDKSVHAIAAILAILKIRACYVPIDTSQPLGRRETIINEAKLSGVFTIQEGEVIFLKYENFTFNQEFAYILFTSGSTGVPKGVPITHANALAFLNWAIEEFNINNSDVLSSHAPFHFDLSVFDLYASLMTGASLVLFDQIESKHPNTLVKAIETNGITIWYSTPTILKLMLQLGDLKSMDSSSLRLVFFAGEVLSVKHLKELSAACPSAEFVNWYGPTETNVCTSYRISDSWDFSKLESIPIGIACSGNVVSIIDNEIVVSGKSVMQGYLNSDSSNAFIEADGKKWYKTGDKGRIDENGNLYYTGRFDRMVKRRGYRIELGEIEKWLINHNTIIEAAVVSSGKVNIKITAYVQAIQNEIIGTIALKSYCSTVLPQYMIPDEIVYLDVIPKTSTNKTDYRKLEKLTE